MGRTIAVNDDPIFRIEGRPHAHHLIGKPGLSLVDTLAGLRLDRHYGAPNFALRVSWPLDEVGLVDLDRDDLPVGVTPQAHTGSDFLKPIKLAVGVPVDVHVSAASARDLLDRDGDDAPEM